MAITLNLWTHESSLFPNDAVLNYDLVPSAKPGDIFEIRAQNGDEIALQHNHSSTGKLHAKREKEPVYLMPSPLTDDLKRRHPNLQLSVVSHISSLLNIKNREPVVVKICEDKTNLEAEHVVIFFRDQFISRSDMWKLFRELCGKCVYLKQRVSFIGDVPGEIRCIWRKGKKCHSAYISERTKPIFRSESARFLIFIQMSEEMWHFEEDGELNYNKAIDGFLPDLFSFWRDLGTHHLVSIILFTRVEYSHHGPMCVWQPRFKKNSEKGSSIYPHNSFNASIDNEGGPYEDFFKVVVDNVSSRDWQPVLANLKLELAKFRQDVIVRKIKDENGREIEYICGRMTGSQEGNFLEVINMAVFQFQSDYIDRDLSRTGTSIIIVTPGTGLYEVNEKMLHLTSKSLLNTVVGMDIVSLGKVPLFLTPIVRYKNPVKNKKRSQLTSRISSSVSPSNVIPNSLTSSVSNFSVSSFLNNLKEDTEWLYTFPIGCNISFYSTTEMRSLRSPWENLMREHQFEPTAKMHELQMMGVLEAESAKISIPLLQSDPLLKGSVFSEEVQEDYDERQFTGEAAVSANDVLSSSSPRHFSSHTPVNVDKSSYLEMNGHSLSTVISGKESISSFGAKVDDLKSTSKESARQFGKSALTERLQKLAGNSSNVSSTLQTPSSNKSSLLTKKSSFPALLKGFLALPATVTTSANPLGFKSTIQRPIPIKNNEDSDSCKAFSQAPQIATKKSPTFLKPNSPEYAKTVIPKSSTNLENEYQTPWKIIQNPFKLKETTADNDPVSLRWEHLYMKVQDVRKFNWLSMCTPGALPLTFSYFPSEEELNDKFEEYTYTIGIDPEFTQMNQQELLAEMICQRLSRGYQIVVNPAAAVSYSGNPKANKAGTITDFSRSVNNQRNGHLTVGSDAVCLSLGDSQFHRLSCDSVGYNIEVKRYVKKVSGQGKMRYDYNFWSKNECKYVKSNITFSANDSANYNWNYVDQLICGFETYLPDSVKYWRARFVLLPMSTTSTHVFQKYQLLDHADALSDEEFRVEGIYKLSELLYKGKIDPMNDSNNKTPNTSPAELLGIKFTTLPMAQYIHSELEALRLDSSRNEQSLFMPNKRLDCSADLHTIAKEIQGPGGPKIDDITWHYRIYENCFLGSEFVSWLANTFIGINTREEALKYGNKLLSLGLFDHALKKHPLLDGYYVYRISPDYSIKPVSNRPYRSWFSRKKDSGQKHLDNKIITESEAGPSRLELSRRILFNADVEKKNGKSETVTVHYDLLHNPASCYHIRIEWLLATASVIEKLLQSWSRILERYGLKLVEAPIHEIAAVGELNPFDQVSIISLALDPPPIPERAPLVNDPVNYSKNWWNVKILEHFDFILDTEAASTFPKSITAVYSWGKPNFRYVQYIHRTGTVLVQIDDDQRFLWLPNRLHNSKVSKLSFTKSNKSTLNPNLKETAEELERKFREFCSNKDELDQFYGIVNHASDDRRSIYSSASTHASNASADDASNVNV
ncbi:Vacuolar membrane-associated protein iml1 [Schizosaccharomyces pombe]